MSHMHANESWPGTAYKHNYCKLTLSLKKNRDSAQSQMVTNCKMNQPENHGVLHQGNSKFITISVEKNPC